eukprot:COSAG05_NODE_798_length_7245_cov_46.630982_6_plen_190_part_00
MELQWTRNYKSATDAAATVDVELTRLQSDGFLLTLEQAHGCGTERTYSASRVISRSRRALDPPSRGTSAGPAADSRNPRAVGRSSCARRRAASLSASVRCRSASCAVSWMPATHSRRRRVCSACAMRWGRSGGLRSWRRGQSTDLQTRARTPAEGMPVDFPARQRAARSTDLESCSSGLKSRGPKSIKG